MLTYPYRSTSTLPRRSFAVSAAVSPVGAGGRFTDHVTLEVTAPDAVAAETVARVALSKDDRVASFRFDLVREVVLEYDRETGTRRVPVVRVPDLYRSALTVCGVHGPTCTNV